jgi:signal transduction histidine kinase
LPLEGPPAGLQHIRLKTDVWGGRTSYGRCMQGAAISVRARVVVADRRLVDAGLAVVLTVMAQVQLPASASVGLRAAMLVTTASLAWRRRATAAVTVAVAVSVAVMGLSANPPSVFGEYLAVMLASFTLAERYTLLPAAGGLLLLIAGIVAHDWRSPEFGGASGFVSDSAIPVVIWLVGRAVYVQRSRADRSREMIRQLESERQGLAVAAVAEERLRLARELHDVVTHSVSVIIIQAQGAQRVGDADKEQVSDSLKVIESAGRVTLTEMRRLLGLLREENAASRAPQPGMADLPHLADQVRKAGLPVTVTISGTPAPLEPGIDLSAYRIVQEALTNSLKYARPATAAVTITWLDDSVELMVTDTGNNHAAITTDGRGLVGMRERVTTYGGQLETGPLSTGGFRVRCQLPLRGPA